MTRVRTNDAAQMAAFRPTAVILTLIWTVDLRAPNSRRTAFRRRKLTPERIEKLEALDGWEWDVVETGLAGGYEALHDLYRWARGYEALEEYVAEHRRARVPRAHRTDDRYALGAWVGTQRTAFIRRKLMPERIGKLEALDGWVWQVS